jgi:HD-GYP domain-containing protein (c-di-GMP phosphodiesterase class II)
MAETEVIEVRVDVDKLKAGMYVCRLDRPWLETSFAMQGFPIHGPEDIAAVAVHCQYVYIDQQRSIYAGQRKRVDYGHLQKLVRPEALARLDRLGFRNMRGHGRPLLIPIDYPAAIELAKELPRAINAWKQARMVLNQCIARAKAGKKMSPEDIDTAVEPIVESVVRSPDATLWLVALRRLEAYPTSHPLNCCAMVLVFGRFLGFPPEILLSMAKGALLMDIGMWRLKQNYYIKRDLLVDEAKTEIYEHVLNGLEYLDQSGFADIDANLTILHHHERYDGNGYPRAVRGEKVSLMGFMLGIVDSFDAMCSKRSYHAEEALTAVQRSLYQERDLRYPAEVVEVFFQCLGVYPTGTFVELSTGQIAAVSGQRPESRLYPRLIVLTEADRSPLSEFSEVESADLIKQPDPIKIMRSLPSSSVEIRLDKVEPKVRESLPGVE